jgi:hypothetical protein
MIQDIIDGGNNSGVVYHTFLEKISKVTARVISDQKKKV